MRLVVDAVANRLSISASTGTPRLFTRANSLGAMPCSASAYSMRVEAYMPELPADSTEVSTTAFITAAAPSRPACWNTRVNGLTEMSPRSFLSSWGSVYGISRPMIRIANT